MARDSETGKFACLVRLGGHEVKIAHRKKMGYNKWDIIFFDILLRKKDMEPEHFSKNAEMEYFSKEIFLCQVLSAEGSLEAALKKCREMTVSHDIIFGIVFYTELLYRLGKKKGDAVLINKAQDNFVGLKSLFPLMGRYENIDEDLRYFENLW
jgi:hypothetical protein